MGGGRYEGVCTSLIGILEWISISMVLSRSHGGDF